MVVPAAIAKISGNECRLSQYHWPLAALVHRANIRRRGVASSQPPRCFTMRELYEVYKDLSPCAERLVLQWL